MSRWAFSFLPAVCSIIPINSSTFQIKSSQMPICDLTLAFHSHPVSVCRAVNRLNVAIIGAFSGADWSYFTFLKVYNKRGHCWAASWFMWHPRFCEPFLIYSKNLIDSIKFSIRNVASQPNRFDRANSYFWFSLLFN